MLLATLNLYPWLYGTQSSGNLQIRICLYLALNLKRVWLNQKQAGDYGTFCASTLLTYVLLEGSVFISYRSFLISEIKSDKVVSKVLNNSQTVHFIFFHILVIFFSLYTHIVSIIVLTTYAVRWVLDFSG